MSIDDPFFVAKAEVEQATAQLYVQFQRWRRLLEETNTESSKDFAQVTDDVRARVKQIEEELCDLTETIKIVQTNPQKWRLTMQDIRQREEFVDQYRKNISDILSELSSTSTKAKIEKDQREMLMRRKTQEYQNELDAEMERERILENEEFIRENDPQRLIAQQDSALDDVHATAINLKHIATTIRGELDDQEQLLGGIDAHTDQTSSKLGTAVRKVEKLYKSAKDNKSMCAIVVLAIIAVVLLVVYFIL